MHYYLMDPTKNITVLVTDPVPEEDQPRVAGELLAAEKEAEQVGFISEGDGSCDIRLRMAGGEFCGNASMSAAALYVMNLKSSAKDIIVRVACSGCTNTVFVNIRRDVDGYLGSVVMPGPITVDEEPFTKEGFTLVRMPGICHVFSDKEITESDEQLKVKLAGFCEKLGTTCAGIHYYDEKTQTMGPIVYEKTVDSLYHESSCASGTSALGVMIASKKGENIALDVHEPGGILRIEADPSGRAVLTGHVQLIAEKNK